MPAPKPLHVIVATPRGFCAGVERAIKCVEQALERYGPPVYVLNHIVHNASVVNALRDRGAIFVHDLATVPPGAHLLFSAHGVSPERWQEARRRHLDIIDATCPLVEKVHQEAQRFAREGRTVLLIGTAGHDETVGTMGWAPDHIRIVETLEDVETLDLPDPEHVAYVTQTTLSIEDAEHIIAALRARFPHIVGPARKDICYATSNRQRAVIELAPEVDLVLVVGDPESANSTRLANIARGRGKPAHLIPDAGHIDPAWIEGVEHVLLTSGASVPEALVQGVIDYLRDIAACVVEEHEVVEESLHFRLPAELD